MNTKLLRITNFLITNFLFVISRVNSTLFLLLLLSGGNGIHAQTSGGPDTFGYIWANNQDVQGPIYNWKDIRNTSTILSGLKDDNAIGPFNLGFNFRYYGIDYDSLWIGSNGWISFQVLGSIAAPFPSIPSVANPNNFIAGMLSDLTFIDLNSSAVPGASVYWWTNNLDSAIVQYDSVPFWVNSSSGYSGRNTFQIILTGTGNSITLQYKLHINGTPAYDLANEGLKTGIENLNGQIGLQVISDTFPLNSTALKFFYPNTFSTNNINLHALLLLQNFPNPCSDFTMIRYTIEKSKNVEIAIHNMIGKKIESFSLGSQPAGSYSINLNTQWYDQGVYFCTLSAEGMRVTKKITVVK